MDLVTQFQQRSCFGASTPGVVPATAEPAGRFPDLENSLDFPAYSATCVEIPFCLPFGIQALCKIFVVLHYEDPDEKKHGNAYTYTF